MKLFLTLLSLVSLQTCISSTPPVDRNEPIWEPQKNEQKDLAKAYFAAGCFWCVEAIFESVKGVDEVYSGYAGGETKNPNYNQIGTGRELDMQKQLKFIMTQKLSLLVPWFRFSLGRMTQQPLTDKAPIEGLNIVQSLFIKTATKEKSFKIISSFWKKKKSLVNPSSQR